MGGTMSRTSTIVPSTGVQLPTIKEHQLGGSCRDNQLFHVVLSERTLTTNRQPLSVSVVVHYRDVRQQFYVGPDRFVVSRNVLTRTCALVHLNCRNRSTKRHWEKHSGLRSGPVQHKIVVSRVIGHTHQLVCWCQNVEHMAKGCPLPDTHKATV